MGRFQKVATQAWQRVGSFIQNNIAFCVLLAVFFMAHLPGLTNPPLDLHSWRQTDTAAVARNLREESVNIFMPRIDMRAQHSGVTGMEFPLYNGLLYLTNTVFGFAHWHGRLISLLASCMGMGFFYAFVKRRYDQQTAIVAAGGLALLPLWFYFSRNIQPDVLMVSLSLGAIYYAQRFSETGKRRQLILLLIFFSLACLVKLPAVFIAPVILAIIGWRRIRKAMSWQNVGWVILLVVLPSLLWYRQSAYLSANYGLGQYYYGDLSLKLSYELLRQGGLIGVLQFYNLPFAKSTFFYYVFALFGLIRLVARRDWVPLIWAGSIGAFLLIFGNKSFYHNYYSLPLTPILALVMAIGAVWLYQVIAKESRWVAVVLSIVVVVAAAKHTYQTIKPWYALGSTSALRLEQIMDRLSERRDLVAVNWSGNPQLLYFAHRKGWSLADLSPTALRSLQPLGLKYAVIDTRGDQVATDAAEQSYASAGMESVYRDSDFLIVRVAR